MLNSYKLLFSLLFTYICLSLSLTTKKAFSNPYNDCPIFSHTIAPIINNNEIVFQLSQNPAIDNNTSSINFLLEIRDGIILNLQCFYNRNRNRLVEKKYINKVKLTTVYGDFDEYITCTYNPSDFLFNVRDRKFILDLENINKYSQNRLTEKCYGTLKTDTNGCKIYIEDETKYRLTYKLVNCNKQLYILKRNDNTYLPTIFRDN